MIEANGTLFKRFLALVPEELLHHVRKPSAARWIATGDDDKMMLKNARIVSHAELLPGVHAAIIVYQNSRFAVLPGNAPVSSPLRDAYIIKTSPGLLTLLGCEDWFPISSRSDIGLTALEQLFGREDSYALDEILPFFAPFYLLDVSAWTDSSPDIRQVFRLSVTAFIGGGGRLPLNFPSETLARIKLIAESDEHGELAGALFRALTATHWVHAFLELYRCVERFFAAPFIEDLRHAIGVASHQDLLREIDTHLTWKPKEDQALEALLKQVDQATVARFSRLFGVSGDTAKGEASAVALRIYKTRNSIAHHRSGAAPVLADKEWPELVSSLCDLTAEIAHINSFCL